MSVHSRMLNPTKLNGNQAAGIVVWLISAWATALFAKQIGIEESVSYIIGIGIQFLFTRAELPVWRKQGYPVLGIVVALFDSALNAVGVWPYIRDNFGNTELWRMTVDVTSSASNEPTLAVRVVFALAVGIAVAAAPEYFWSRKD